MADVLSPTEFAQTIAGMSDNASRLFGESLLRVMPKAELLAKQNVKKNFPGRNGYRLTGQLLNSIGHGFKEGRDTYTGTLFSKGIPYGAIHEFGGEIKPRKAKHLWVKNYEVSNKRRRMTPKEFMAAKSRQKPGDQSQFAILKARSSGKLTAFEFLNGKAEALFFLRDQVTIPARPYLQPAIDEIAKEWEDKVDKKFDQEL